MIHVAPTAGDMVFGSVLDLGVVVFVMATLRLLQLLWRIRWARLHQRSCFSSSNNTNTKAVLPRKTLVVLGSGGHTTEMLSLVQALRMEEADDRHPTYSPIVYCKASSDTTSVAQLQQQLTKLSTTTTQTKFPVHDIPRARHVGQSYVSSVWTTLRAQLYALHLVWQLAPRLVLCNGPGTCVPICLAALWFRYLGLLRVEIVFCESLCRVRTLSLTGKLLYFWADVFLVHWDELQAQYPRTTLRTCVFMTASLNKQ